MKRLLVLLLVLGLTTIAGAACTSLQISVNGDKNPVNSQIALMPSEHLVLDIWTTTDISVDDEGWWALVCKTQDATISGGASLWDGAATIYPNAAGAGILLPAGDNGVFGQIGLIAIPIPAGSKIYDQIDFHLEWMPNDVLVTLYVINDDLSVTPIDSVVVHQIPEPATMLLLGLGGLLLRRRT